MAILVITRSASGKTIYQDWNFNAYRLITSTIRDNILLGQPYKEKRYRKVLSACDLDIDIAMLPAGDLTEVGDSGMMLSGQFRYQIYLELVWPFTW